MMMSFLFLVKIYDVMFFFCIKYTVEPIGELSIYQQITALKLLYNQVIKD